MSRAVSIHIGVNDPQGQCAGQPRLRHSEATAWRMAELANRAGYDSLLVLRGPEATCQAVDDALAGAARTLAAGDILFISFSGHGARVRDLDWDDEPDGWDEAWCLHDGILLDDKLAGFWRLFEPGVRILVVAENCFGGGSLRGRREGGAGDGGVADAPRVRRPPPSPRRGPLQGVEAAPAPTASCIGAPLDADGIRASLLLLAASCEHRPAEDGVYAKHLLDIWNNGAFPGSFCELHRKLRARLLGRGAPEPQILMLGAPDLRFPLEPAFHLHRGRRAGPGDPGDVRTRTPLRGRGGARREPDRNPRRGGRRGAE
jgi:metacaspase-1